MRNYEMVEVMVETTFAEEFERIIKHSVFRQEDPNNRVIVECEIHSKNRFKKEVWIKSNCDGWCEDIKVLFSYYPDELHFSASDFIGMTEKQGVEYFHSKDISYLRR